MKPRILTYAALLTGALLVSFAPSNAGADERYRPVDDPLTKKECGACHMTFQPQMLPRKSWEKIMDGLADHFGENASLPAESAQHIRQYLTANAADSRWRATHFLRGLDKNAAPLRITETPYWVREHRGEVPDSAWANPKVKSKANCVACHKDAERGYYDDD